jgi:uncharacterized protein (TIGR00255 family)
LTKNIADDNINLKFLILELNMLSMTGYGYTETTEDNVDIVVEIKSVNNRYCDVNIKMPYFLNPYESDIKKMILKKAQRGKIDVVILLKDREPDYEIIANTELAKKYYNCYDNLINALGLHDDVRFGYLLKAEGVITIQEDRDSERLWNMIKKYINQTLEQYYNSKKAEGEETSKHILECVENMEKQLSEIRSNMKEYTTNYEEKIRKKINDLIGDEFDENRVLQEVGIVAAKTDISEEVERLEAHVKQFKKNCKKNDAIGRQLDFISQEMNREINTIGAKANSVDISENVIGMKIELEKIKEQIRNVE